MWVGVPRQLQNFLNLQRNSSVSIVRQTSVWTALVFRQMNRHAYALWYTGLRVDPSLSLKGPAKSMPTCVNAVRSGVVLDSGEWPHPPGCSGLLLPDSACHH